MSKKPHPIHPRGKLTAVKKKVVKHLVEINEVQHDHSELLGYVEGLKFATPEKPMPVYNEAIREQLIADGLAAPATLPDGMLIKVDAEDKLVICTNEEARAAFEAEIRSLDFGE